MVRPPNMLSLPQVQFFALLVRAYNAYSAQADSRTQIKSMTGKRIVGLHSGRQAEVVREILVNCATDRCHMVN